MLWCSSRTAPDRLQHTRSQVIEDIYCAAKRKSKEQHVKMFLVMKLT